MTGRNPRFWLVALIACFVLAGCASTHNRNKDGYNPSGGGVYDQEIASGLYRLTASANRSLWPTFGAAVETWRWRADQLCGNNQYQEIVATRDTGYQGTASTYVHPGLHAELPIYNTTIVGHILCNTSGMTRSQATKFLGDLAATKAQELAAKQTTELDELGGRTCSGSVGLATAESYFRRGKILSAQNDYQSALVCFMRAQEREQETNIHREACIAIGTMYELGWGVEKDLATAMTWYKKGGLATDN